MKCEDLAGIDICTLCTRINKLGWSIERAVNTPVRNLTNNEN